MENGVNIGIRLDTQICRGGGSRPLVDLDQGYHAVRWPFSDEARGSLMAAAIIFKVKDLAYSPRD
jgi:hypothetical protein